MTDAAPGAIPLNAGVAEPSADYLGMVDGWKLIDALHGGTKTMRAATTDYLPQEPKEKDDAYQVRLKRSVLYPGLRKALRNFVGKAFTNSVSFKDIDDTWAEWFKNIDLAGTSMQKFCETAFLNALKYGHTAIAAEYPTVQAGANLFVERQVMQARPYLIERNAKQLIGWRSEMINNQAQLTRLRIAEQFTEYVDKWDDDGAVDQIRVLEPGKWQVWREAEAGKDWEMTSEGQVSIKGQIPVSVVYFDQTGLLTSQPTMIDLAWLNVAHWQSYSDQRNILRVARVPMIFAKGVSTEDLGGEMTIGPNRFIAVASANADMKFLEHSGAAIGAGRQDCIDLEDRMNMMAAEALMSRPGSETATGKAIDSRDATSPLATWVAAFETSMNRALEFMAEYAQQDSAPVMQMTRDFGIIGNTSDLDTLYKARIGGEISRQTFLSELQRRGVLSETFDEEVDQELLDAEGPRNPQGDPNNPDQQGNDIQDTTDQRPPPAQ